MPRKADLTEVGVKSHKAIGLIGGGYSCRLDVTRGANSGHMILSTDEGGIAIYKSYGQTEWKQLFRYGDNLPESEAVYGGKAFHAYLVARSSSNPNVMVASMYGKIYRTTTGAEPSSPGAQDAWTKLTAYKDGLPDLTLHHGVDLNARLRGPTCQIDPINANLFLFGNPIDGAYLSADGGTTINLISTAQIPAPVNVGDARWGVNFAFDDSTASLGKVQTVYCSSSGNGVRRSTAGADSGAWTNIGGPTMVRDMFAAGGLLWVCDDTQLVWKWDGTTWAQMFNGAAVNGSSVAVRPSNPLHVAVLQTGGGTSNTTNGGTTWTKYDFAFGIGSGEPVWLQATAANYLSPGMMRWDETGATNRWCLSMGLGYCEFDNPPRVSLAAKWRADSLGILELITTSMHFTEKGNLLAGCQDRAFWAWDADNLLDAAPGHGPNYLNAITHGTDISSLIGDPDFVVAARFMDAVHPSYFKHLGGGIDANAWVAIPDPGTTYKGGNIVALSRTNYIILPTSAVLGPKYTLDGGTTWLSGEFRKTPGGTIVDMSAIGWGSNQIYTSRRKILVPIEGTVGGALMFVSGNGPAGDPRTGIWKTVDGGANWVGVFDGHMNGINLDFYNVKMRPVKGYPNAWFWVAGAVSGPIVDGVKQPSGPAARFTNDQFVTNALLSGFNETFDIAVGPSDTNASGARTNPFGWVYVSGFRGSTVNDYQIWVSKDFNPANPAAATWTADVKFPGGRSDLDGVIVANPKRPGQYVIATPAGGAFLRQLEFAAKAA